MPASKSGTANPTLASYSRSHEGPGAGSSDQPGRWNQRASSAITAGASGQKPTRASRPQSSSALPAGFVEDARHMLLEQRTFRIDQLNRLDTTSGTRSDLKFDAARDEVDATLRQAAQLVLALIDAALRRIEQGSYGRCHRCGDLMSLERLAALPTSTWCGSCQHTEETACGEPAPAAGRAP